MSFSFSDQKCLECEAPLVGRTDKKFCGDQCRSIYNNRVRREHEKNIIALNSQLRRNRSILKTLCPTGKATVRRTVLEDMGYNFGHFTSIFRYRENTYYFTYEYGFMPIVDKNGVQKVVIVQRQSSIPPYDPWK